jgi:hypothetical protein
MILGLAWRSLEARIHRDSEFRCQMIEQYRTTLRKNSVVGEHFDAFLRKPGIQDEVHSPD